MGRPPPTSFRSDFLFCFPVPNQMHYHLFSSITISGGNSFFLIQLKDWQTVSYKWLGVTLTTTVTVIDVRLTGSDGKMDCLHCVQGDLCLLGWLSHVGRSWATKASTSVCVELRGHGRRGRAQGPEMPGSGSPILTSVGCRHVCWLENVSPT